MDAPCPMTWIPTTRRSTRTSPTTAILTCTRANLCCCASSARDAGSTRSTSTRNHVRILARDGNLHPHAGRQCSAGPALFTTTTTPGHGHGWNLLLHRQGPELGHVRPPSGIQRSQRQLPCTPDANGYNTGAPTAINYLRMVPGPQQAACRSPPSAMSPAAVR